MAVDVRNAAVTALVAIAIGDALPTMSGEISIRTKRIENFYKLVVEARRTAPACYV